MKRESMVMMTLVFALVLIGVSTVYSASVVEIGKVNPTDIARLKVYGYERLQRQLVSVAIGLMAMLAAAHFDYNRLRSPMLFRLLAFGSLGLLIFVLVPGIGDVRYGARRWIQIGPQSFQPSEIAKFAMIVLLAAKMSENREHIRTFWRGFLPPLTIGVLFAGLVVLEKDLGTPVVMCAVAYIMLFVAGVRWRYLIPSMVPAVAGVVVLVITSPHRVERITAFLDPWADKKDTGYQLIQSLAAFAKGSVWGRGAGASEQKLFYLPMAHTDSIFAVWGEEMGLVGTLTLLSIFLAFVFVGMRIAMNARDFFGTLLAVGIVALIGVQAGVNMAVTIGLLPTKGLPLPYISWGGSSLIVFMGLAGILINVGLHAEPPAPVRKGAVAHAAA